MVRDAIGHSQAIVGDIPGLLWVKCVGRYYSGNRYELQFSNRRKTAWFASQIFRWAVWKDFILWSFLCLQFLLSDNYNLEFQEIYESKNEGSEAKYFQFLIMLLNRILSHIFF